MRRHSGCRQVVAAISPNGYLHAPVKKGKDMKSRFQTLIPFLSAAAIAVGVTFGSAKAVPSPSAVPLNSLPVTEIAAASPRYRDGAFTGPSTDAYYGQLQVQANIQGGKVVSVNVLQFPDHSRTSRRINDSALPVLQTEAIRVQTGSVDIVSGATLTSRAYQRSLNAALRQAVQ